MDMKTSKRIPPGTPKYHRLTSENRIIIWTLKKEGKSETYIAARIGCSVSTISRELDRNKGKKGYRHKKAQGMAQHRIAVKAAKRRGGTCLLIGKLEILVDRMCTNIGDFGR